MRTGRMKIGHGFALVLALAGPGMAGARAGEGSQSAGGDIHVVFVPGTSGSILKFRDGSVFWLDSSSLASTTVAMGRLNASGGEEGVESLTTDGIVDAVAFVPPAAVMAE